MRGHKMMRRIRLLSASVLCIGLLGSVLVSCFGGGDDPPDTTVATTAPVVTTTTVPSDSTTTSDTGSTTTDGAASTTEYVTTTEIPTLVDGLPGAYVDAFGKRPIVVLFYVPGGVDDEKVLRVVRELQSSYRSYTFLTYDYRIPAAYGDLSTELAIGYSPEIVMKDRYGQTRYVWNGIIDKGTLNQSLITLGRY